MSKKEKPVTTMSIMQFPIGHNQNEVFTYVRTDRELVDAACRYADKLREQDVEIFERKGNVIEAARDMDILREKADIGELEFIAEAVTGTGGLIANT